MIKKVVHFNKKKGFFQKVQIYLLNNYVKSVLD